MNLCKILQKLCSINKRKSFALSVLPLCLHYAPWSATLSKDVVISERCIRAIHYKVSINLSRYYTMHFSALLQFTFTTDYSTRERQSIFKELIHNLKYSPPNVLALCWHNTLACYVFYYVDTGLANLKIY